VSGLDDELDAELRRLFGDERLDMRPKSDAPQAIVAGVQRIRRRRRAVRTAAGSVAVAALLVAGGLTFGPFRAQNGVAALPTNALATGASTPAGSGPSASAPSTAPTSTVDVVPPIPTANLPGVGTETPPKKPTKSPTSSPRSSTNFVSAGPELRADGFGKLKLGMTETEASAQGIRLQKISDSGQCVFYGISGNGVPASGSVAISNTYGLVIIEPSTPAHTPEGVGKGSSKDDVLRKYAETVSNAAATSASAGPESTYRFDVDTANMVQAVALYSVKQDCTG
jgi:hypothetical protein